MLVFSQGFPFKVYFCDIQYHPPKFCKQDLFFLILRQNLRLLLPKPTMVCLLFAFWLLGLSITGFAIKIFFTLILGLIFVTFTIL